MTGSMAAGKSTAARRLRERGAFVLDADEIARELVAPGSKALARVRERFGDQVMNPDGTLDRAALAGIVFRDKRALHDLNGIIHPLVIARMEKRANEYEAAHEDPVIVFDAALLIEAGMHEAMDAVWLITAGRDTLLQRARLRDQMPYEAAKRRICAQLDEEKKRAYATAVIDNSGTEEELIERIDALYDALGR